MQCMPILIQYRAQSCWTPTYSHTPFLDWRTSYVGVATWCIGPSHRNSQILRAFLKTFSFMCNFQREL